MAVMNCALRSPPRGLLAVMLYIAVMAEASGCGDEGAPENPPSTARALRGYGCGFLYGMNYAWRHFGGDFGGVELWRQQGVSADPAPYRADLARMRAHGVRAVRWWMFPEFRGQSALWDSENTPVQVGPNTINDVRAALALADELDVDLMFTLFSFDGFRKTRSVDGLTIPGLAPLVRDPGKRARLLQALVHPVAQAVAASPHAHRMVAWDVINEPEWALFAQPGLGGDPPFRPLPTVDDPVSHAEMAAFIAEVIAVLRVQTPSVPISIGSAATVWRNAWRGLDTDFHQFHMYGWVNAEWVEGVPGRAFAYDKSPRELAIDDKPVVMGEFGLQGLWREVDGKRTLDVPHERLVTDWKKLGYAGAMSWSLTEGSLTAEQVQAGLATSLRVSRLLGCDDDAAGP